MKDFRCSNCGKLFLKADIIGGVMEHKCKCGAVTKLTIKPDGRSFEQKLNLQRTQSEPQRTMETK
jgi:phage FluMu protein Com